MITKDPLRALRRRARAVVIGRELQLHEHVTTIWIKVLLIATFSVRRRPVACQRLIDRVIRRSLVIVVSAI